MEGMIPIEDVIRFVDVPEPHLERRGLHNGSVQPNTGVLPPELESPEQFDGSMPGSQIVRAHRSDERIGPVRSDTGKLESLPAKAL